MEETCIISTGSIKKLISILFDCMYIILIFASNMEVIASLRKLNNIEDFVSRIYTQWYEETYESREYQLYARVKQIVMEESNTEFSSIFINIMNLVAKRVYNYVCAPWYGPKLNDGESFDEVTAKSITQRLSFLRGRTFYTKNYKKDYVKGATQLQSILKEEEYWDLYRYLSSYFDHDSFMIHFGNEQREKMRVIFEEEFLKNPSDFKYRHNVSTVENALDKYMTDWKPRHMEHSLSAEYMKCLTKYLTYDHDEYLKHRKTMETLFNDSSNRFFLDRLHASLF
jgi:hypothetical protein